MSQRSAADDAGGRIRRGDGACRAFETRDWLIVFQIDEEWAGPPAE